MKKETVQQVEDRLEAIVTRLGMKQLANDDLTDMEQWVLNEAAEALTSLRLSPPRKNC